MKRHIALFAGIAALSGLMAAGSARADQFVFGFSSGHLTSNQLDLTLGDNSIVQAPLDVNPATGGSTAYSGWYTDSGINSGAINDNYFVGSISGVNYADFLVYNLTGVSAAIQAGGGVVSASEVIRTFSVSNGPETVSLWDINTPPATLDSYPTGSAAIAIYNDLSSGKSYGSHTYNNGDPDSNVDITLNQNFLNDVNAAVIGGAADIGIGHSTTAPTGVPLPSPLAAGMVLLGIVAVGRKLARGAIA